MKIKLELNYRSEIFEILGEIGYEEEKKEYLVYLKAANEANGDIVDYLHKKLLSKFPISTARNIILELKALQLIDNNDNLTDAGRESLSSKKIFEPTKGVYTLEILKDSPNKSPVINLRQDRVHGNDAPVDDIVFNEIGKSIKLLDGQVIRIISLEKSGRKSKDRSNITIEFIYNKKWTGFLSIGKRRKQKIDLSNEFLDMKLEDTILEQFTTATGSPQTILVESRNLSDKEIIEFKGTQKIKNFSLPKYNKTIELEIQDLDYLPYNDNEAFEWALRLFILKYLDDYGTKDELFGKWDYMVEEMEQFQFYDIRYPNVYELLDNIKGELQRWFILAPIDFELEV